MSVVRRGKVLGSEKGRRTRTGRDVDADGMLERGGSGEGAEPREGRGGGSELEPGGGIVGFDRDKKQNGSAG